MITKLAFLYGLKPGFLNSLYWRLRKSPYMMYETAGSTGYTNKSPWHENNVGRLSRVDYVAT